MFYTGILTHVLLAATISLSNALPQCGMSRRSDSLTGRSDAGSLFPKPTSPSLSLAKSQWIWTGENAGAGGAAPVGPRPFRKTILPCEKKPTCATIIITADNGYTLFVNGAQIGGVTATLTNPTFTAAQVFYVALQDTSNTIAVTATNTGGPAGLIATVLVEYTDGTSDTIVTDDTWKTLKAPPPAGFQLPPFNDNPWPNAVTQGLDGVSPWGVTTLPPALDLTQSNWIWTNENANGAAPIGSRAFRKRIDSPTGKCPACAVVVISADNSYTLYLNGVTVGTGNNWPAAQVFHVSNLQSSSNLFAVLAANSGGPAAFIATILITYSDGTSATFITDTTWKSGGTTVPPNFQLEGTSDASWVAATSLGKYGVQPWGNIVVPTA